MRMYSLVLGTAALLSPMLQAQSTSMITENITGTISGAQTTDKAGLFGAPGANLAGKTITLHLQYVPSYFNSNGKCRVSPSVCTYDRSQGSPNTPGAVLISVTVNGRQQAYSSTYFGETILSNQPPRRFVLSADASSGFAMTNGRGCMVSTLFESPLVFGQPLSPGNPPTLNNNADFVDFFQNGGQLPAETLSFLVTGATA